MIVLGSFLYLISIFLGGGIIGELFGMHPETVGVTLVYMIVFPTTWVGLGVCILLIVWLKELGVILSPVLGAVYVCLVLFSL